jgi:hypothetical protein
MKVVKDESSKGKENKMKIRKITFFLYYPFTYPKKKMKVVKENKRVL